MGNKRVKRLGFFSRVERWNGEEEGKSVWYDEDGNITDEDIYKDGECVEMCEGDEKE
jgi:hypothetical protein